MTDCSFFGEPFLAFMMLLFSLSFRVSFIKFALTWEGCSAGFEMEARRDQSECEKKAGRYGTDIAF